MGDLVPPRPRQSPPQGFLEDSASNESSVACLGILLTTVLDKKFQLQCLDFSSSTGHQPDKKPPNLV